MKLVVLIHCIILALFACDDNPIHYRNIMPPSLYFVIVDKDGKPLITEDTPDEIYYYDNNGQKQSAAGVGDGFNHIGLFYDTTRFKCYYDAPVPSIQSSNNGIKNFFIDLEQKTDTIYLDVQSYPESADPILGKYFIGEVKFNGEEVKQDTTLSPWVYVFHRK